MAESPFQNLPSLPADELLRVLLKRIGSLIDDLDDDEDLEQLFAWLTWYGEKLPGLSRLNEEELVDKVRLWHKRLDFFLYSGPEAGLSLLPDPAVRTLLQHIRRVRDGLHEAMTRSRIERIEVSEGDPFIPGVIERSDEEPVITTSPSLHGRIAGLSPSHGGYRYCGQVLVPSHARAFLYEHPDEH